MRFDRCLTLSLFQPLGGVCLGARVERLPILMYHSISDDGEEGIHPYYRVATHPRRFAEQMQWVADLGCAGVSLEEALPQLSRGDFGKRQLVVLTFDDGFRDFYTAAWPVLKRHGFTATMYLPTAFVAAPRMSFHGKECLTWGEVRELRAQGIRFGSHTVNHPKLHELPWNEIERELMLSKLRIEQEIEEDIVSFAYPYAFPREDRRFTEPFVDVLRRRGYRNCVTTLVGRVPAGGDPFHLPRLPVNSCDDKALLTAKLEGAYDWMSGVQSCFRHLKAWTKRTPRSAN